MSLFRNTTTSKRRVRELSSSSPLGVVVFSVNAGVHWARRAYAPHCSSGPYLCAGRMRHVIPEIWNSRERENLVSRKVA